MICKWLSHDPDLPDHIRSWYVDRVTKTRVEEYWFVHDIVKNLEPGRALDVATGYVMNWHMLPYILGDLVWDVYTIDHDPRTLDMPAHSRVTRLLSDAISLPFPAEHFDLVTCISSLEHMPVPVRDKAYREMDRVLRPGGTLILTADNYPGITPEALALGAGPRYLDGVPEAAQEERPFPGGKRVAVFVGTKGSDTVTL